MAIITPAQVREHFAKLTGTAEDAILTTHITRADAVLARHCGWVPDSGSPTFEDQTYTVYVDCPDWSEPRILPLDLPPIVSVTSAKIDDTGGEAFATTVSSSDYVIDSKRRRLILKTTATSAWLTGLRLNRVIAVCGLTAATEDLIAAVAMQATHTLNLRHSQGLQTLSVGTGSVTKAYNPEQGGSDFLIPPHVRSAVAPFRLGSTYCA